MTDEQQRALEIYATTIKNCQKMQPKFVPGTAQATLLTNRIAALQIVSGLVAGRDQAVAAAQLQAAVAPIESIVHKTTVARAKYAPGDAMYRRLTPMIAAMTLGLQVLQQRLAHQSR